MNTKLFSILATAMLGLGMSSCSNEDIAEESTNSGNQPSATGIAFVSKGSVEPLATRTSLDVNSSPKNFLWEAGDKIWVKDDTHAWQSSTSVNASELSSYIFNVPGVFDQAHYTVYYPGKNGTNDKVTIATTQNQAEPNTTKHFGEAGDNGIAEASWNAAHSHYDFALDHQAAYLVFKPYLLNGQRLVSTYIKKIQVISNNNIAGTYNITSAGLANETEGSNTITLNLGGSGNYENGFPFNNTSANVALNGAYMVIAPGEHQLTVRYTLYDPQSQVEATVETAFPSHNYKPNDFQPLRGKIAMTDYSNNKYYMWDAAQPYWYGSEWENGGTQPTLPGAQDENYPKNNTHPGWYHEGSGAFEANTNSLFTTFPNANEMVWYAMKGDPHWDAEKAWTMLGHLYKGGMWFKKEKKIAADESITIDVMKTKTPTDVTPSGIDLRSAAGAFTNSNINTNKLSSSELPNYFFLPTLGWLYEGQLRAIGISGNYWSSSATFDHDENACYIGFINSHVTVYGNNRYNGFSHVPFE